MDPKIKLTAARVKLLELTPYLAPAIMRMPVVFTDKLPGGTAAVDIKGRLLFTPAFVDKCDVSELCGVVLHETMHFIYMHHPRMAERDPKLFNVAADVVINEQIRTMGIKLPTGALYRETFGVPDTLQTAEAVYEWLLQQGGGAPGGGKGGGKGAQGENFCGTGDIGDDTTAGDAADAGELAGADAEMMRDQVAAEAARAQGNIPAGLRVWADERTGPPRVNWRSRLAALLARSNSTFVRGRVQSDWRRVSRRNDSMPAGVRLPGRVQPLPRIAAVIDTSGSMFGEGGAVLSEAMGVVQAAGVPVDMLSCDVQAGRVVAVERLRDLQKALVGGGGTDLQPAIDALAPVARYAAIVVFTDGYLGEVHVPAGPRVIWCITATGITHPWMRGDIVRMTPGDV